MSNMAHIPDEWVDRAYKEFLSSGSGVGDWKFRDGIKAGLGVVLAEVYAEGYNDAIDAYGCDAPWGFASLPDEQNPYVEKSDDEDS